MADIAEHQIPLERIEPADHVDDLPFRLPLELTVEDRETIRALVAHADGADRDEYALSALKIGVLALRHAGSQIDADLIQRESSRMLEALEERLAQHSQLVHDRVTGELKTYFDPEDGRFHQRVERLVKRDGELEEVLRRQIGREDSQLALTLLEHVGQDSPLMKMLSPDESKGLLSVLKTTVDTQLKQQRDQLLRQFSLDESDGALARLVRELTDSHGRLSKDLQGKIDEVVKEFSLDEENSALKRLVDSVSASEKKIRDEFSLDNDASALARLKGELMTILGAHVDTNAKFQEEVKVALGKIVVQREEMSKSTRHGTLFEDAVCEFVVRAVQPMGDAAEATGNCVGSMKNCKVGDCVVHLGPDSPAPAASIVVEAKEDASYTLAKACGEMTVARDNRDAQIGLFVFSKASAPSGLEPFARHGDDLIVVWDAEDPLTDVYLHAGLVTARALCIRRRRNRESEVADFDAINEAILEIKRRTDGLDEVRKYAETIESASGKILKRIGINRQALEKQVDLLREKTDDLKGLLASDAE